MFKPLLFLIGIGASAVIAIPLAGAATYYDDYYYNDYNDGDRYYDDYNYRSTSYRCPYTGRTTRSSSTGTRCRYYGDDGRCYDSSSYGYGRNTRLRNCLNNCYDRYQPYDYYQYYDSRYYKPYYSDLSIY